MHYGMAVFRCGHTSKTFQRYVFVSIGFPLDTEEISFGQTEIAELTRDKFQHVKPEIAKRKIFILEPRQNPYKRQFDLSPTSLFALRSN